jgi:hypothetical protein
MSFQSQSSLTIIVIWDVMPCSMVERLLELLEGDVSIQIIVPDDFLNFL